jgi:hypothetical protein
MHPMTAILSETIPFPPTLPAGFEALADEPVYDPARHLALTRPERIVRLAARGYEPDETAACPSDLAITTPFRILSEEGAAALHAVARQLEAHTTGGERIARMVRGGAFRSRFLRDLCRCPVVAAHLSDIAGVALAPHTIAQHLGHLNYAPHDLARAVDKWHHDTLGFDYVMMVSDPTRLDGGEFQYFSGTKQEADALASARKTPPKERIVSPCFPGAGWAVLQQGNMVVHRGARLRTPAERITMVNPYVPRDTAWPDPCTVEALKIVDPHNVVFTEWARHKAWLTRGRLDRLIAELPFTDDRAAIVAALKAAVAEIDIAIRDIESDKPLGRWHYGG